MKNLFIKAVLLMLVVGACSAPKYSYFFSHNQSPSAKQKNIQEIPVNETIPSIQPEITTLYAPPTKEPVALASTKEEFPSLAGPANSRTEKEVNLKISHREKRSLKSELKMALKTFRKEFRNVAPDSAEAEGGKNQLVALLLAIFLGYLGIHRFYLGRIWTAVVQLLLLLLGLFLLFPLYLLAVWVLIDIILIAMGTLTPQSGPYDKTL